MRDEVVISHRARRFALGSADDFFGVWHIRATGLVLVERWPKSAAGWYRAWARFNELEASPEVPSDVAEVRTLHPRFPAVAGLLLVAGVVLGVTSLFPSYLNGVALTATPDQLVEHVLFLAGWTAVVVLAVLGGEMRRAAAAFGVGLSVMAFGFYLSDLGQVISSGGHIAGAGFVLGLLGWLLCAQGCVVAAVVLRGDRLLGRPGRRHPLLLGAAVAISVGLAVSFAPAWDSYRLFAAATGQTASLTAGNAFANPAAVIAANLVVMAVIVVLTVLAVVWEPVLLGASLLAGALVALVAQVVSALVQLATPPGPEAFGISPAQAAQAQLQISAGFTPVFYVYCGFGLALLLLCAAIFRHARQATGRLQRFHPLPLTPEVAR